MNLNDAFSWQTVVLLTDKSGGVNSPANSISEETRHYQGPSGPLEACGPVHDGGLTAAAAPGHASPGRCALSTLEVSCE